MVPLSCDGFAASLKLKSMMVPFVLYIPVRYGPLPLKFSLLKASNGVNLLFWMIVLDMLLHTCAILASKTTKVTNTHPTVFPLFTTYWYFSTSAGTLCKLVAKLLVLYWKPSVKTT